MSDFINHLIMRHLGAGEKVLPRSHALFETNTKAVSLPEEDPVITNLEPNEQHPGQTIAKQTEPGATLSAPNGNLEGNLEVNSSALFASHKPAAGTMPTLVAPVHNESITAAGDKDAHVFTGFIDPIIPVAARNNPSAPAQQEQEQGQMNPFGSLEKNITGTLVTHITHVTPVTAVTPVTPVMPVTPAVPNWINRWQSQSHKESAENHSHTGRNPVINVSIGRIEIRATQPAPAPEPPQQREKPSGVMTLEQYLDRHGRLNGGHS